MNFRAYIITFFILALNAQQVLSQGDSEFCTKKNCFSTLKRYNNSDFVLQGASDFRYLVFDVYSAALYVESNPEILNASQSSFAFDPMRADKNIILTLKYSREIAAEDFIKSTKAYVKKSSLYSNDLEPQFEKLYAAYQNVKAGDTYTLTYNKSSQQTCLLHSEINFK